MMSISSQVQVNVESQTETPLARQYPVLFSLSILDRTSLGGTPSRMPRELCQGSLLPMTARSMPLWKRGAVLGHVLCILREDFSQSNDSG
jgi:hypothetical protein